MPTTLEVSIGHKVLIVAGPVDHDGVPSFLIQHFGDLTTGYRPDGDFGWITAEKARTSLVPVNAICPAETTLASVSALQPFERHLCFGRRDLTFEPVTARHRAVGAKISNRWISSDGSPDFFTGLPVYGLTPALMMPDSGWFRVTGHFDDPKSIECGDPGEVAWCRERFIVTAVAPVDPPGFVMPGTWAQTRLPPIDGRTEHAMIWTGTEAVVWGGYASSAEPDHSTFDGILPRGGAAYDPQTNRWRVVSDAPIVGRAQPIITWTGTEVIVFGGFIGEVARLDGAAWNPATSRWRKLAPTPLEGRNARGEWLDGRLYVVTSTTAASYDPVADRWSSIPAAPIRPDWATVVAAGGRLVIVSFGDGATPPVRWATFDPDSRSWANGEAPIDPMMAGTTVTSVGAAGRVVLPDLGMRFDPVTATWETGSGCLGAGAGSVWTGQWVLGITRAWEPFAGTCRDLPPSPNREAPFDDSNGREFPIAVWTGRQYITWSGGNGGDIVWVPKDGAVFTPEGDLEP